MKILFIHEVNYSNKVVFEMHEFPELMALQGHTVSFLHFPEAPDARTISFRTRKEQIKGRVHADAEITLITPPTLGGGSLERYLAPILSYPALKREIKRGSYDIIVLYAVPTTGWQTVALARHFHVRLVFRALDVSHRIRKTVMAKLVRTAERYVYRAADHLSGNNPAMVNYCTEMSGRTGPTSVDLPPVDLAHFTHTGEQTLRLSLGVPASDRVLLYMGSFFTFSGLDLLIEGLADRLKKERDLWLVLVGGGELDEKLRTICRELGVTDRVIFTGTVPYQTLPAYLQIADVALNPFVPELVTHVALPHKVLQYMAAGVPVVSTRLDGLRGVLGDSSGVTWAKSPADVADKALALTQKDVKDLQSIVERQRQFALSTFTQESSATNFESMLRAVSET